MPEEPEFVRQAAIGSVIEGASSPDVIDHAWEFHFARPLRQTVLVVEDDGFIRKAICEALESAGYKVLTADCAFAATQIHDQYPESVDLLLTDVVLPGTNGRVLAHDLMDLSAGLRVLLISGYAHELKVAALASSRQRIRFMEKPFSITTLLRRVEQILNQPLMCDKWREPGCELLPRRIPTQT